MRADPMVVPYYTTCLSVQLLLFNELAVQLVLHILQTLLSYDNNTKKKKKKKKKNDGKFSMVN